MVVLQFGCKEGIMAGLFPVEAFVEEV